MPERNTDESQSFSLLEWANADEQLYATERNDDWELLRYHMRKAKEYAAKLDVPYMARAPYTVEKNPKDPEGMSLTIHQLQYNNVPSHLGRIPLVHLMATVMAEARDFADAEDRLRVLEEAEDARLAREADRG